MKTFFMYLGTRVGFKILITFDQKKEKNKKAYRKLMRLNAPFDTIYIPQNPCPIHHYYKPLHTFTMWLTKLFFLLLLLSTMLLNFEACNENCFHHKIRKVESFRAMFHRKMMVKEDDEGDSSLDGQNKPHRYSPGGPDPYHHLNVPILQILAHLEIYSYISSLHCTRCFEILVILYQ